jgi:ubiquinone/menaquinone biosynthesis C-methylase UbiE
LPTKEVSPASRLQHEIEHGKYVIVHGSGEVWNWESPAGRIRWQRRVRMLDRHLVEGMKVLELGCGTAYLTRELALTGASIIAIDISPELLEIAQRECSAPNVTFQIQNAYDLTFADASFDAVVGSSVLHHLEIKAALAEIYRVLRPDGSIRFTEPNMLNPQIAIQKNVPTIKKALGDSPDETAFFRWSLRRLMEKSGFRETEITPFDFLHPKLPPSLIPIGKVLGDLLERTPLLSEIAGSLHIRAIK